MVRFILPLLLLSGFLYSCKQIPNDGIPFYMSIDSVTLVTNPANEGPNTNAITDVWAEADAANLGAFELPVNFPVLMENEIRFVINAGIKESGQSNVRVIYPFYQPDTFTLMAQKGVSYSHVPTFRYKSGTVFPVLEDFESGNSFNGINRITTDTNIRYGNACGKISVSALDSNEMGTLIQSVTLTAGKEVWVELDYKAAVPFYVGFNATYSAGNEPVPVLFVNPKEGWNKIYVNLTIPVGYRAANSYTLYFEALRIFGTEGGSVYLDNIKLLSL
ncbi:MAG: hypothetical protein IPP77_06060 [Bacteroidetes bacterium]|nr:hypothetical protein [Bacteroidota bacterium]